MAVPKANWVWMPHSAHLIVGSDCRFHLATKIGKYIVSTVGEYLPDAPVREIFAESRKFNLVERGDARIREWIKKNGGYEDIGWNRKYETMVFKAMKMPESRKGCTACPFVIESGNNIDSDGYSDAGEAYRGHLKMCRKWSKKK